MSQSDEGRSSHEAIHQRDADPLRDETVSRISLLLGRWNGGESGALAAVFEAAYPELCALARARLRGSGGAACDGLDAGLVHEVFLRLAQRGTLQAEHRPHFFKYAGKVMSSVIVDQAR